VQHRHRVQLTGECLCALERGVGAGVVGDGDLEGDGTLAAQIVVQRSYADAELLLLVVNGDDDLDGWCGVSWVVRDIA